jgi:hypothetical protein
MNDELMKVIQEICDLAPAKMPMPPINGGQHDDEDYGYNTAYYDIAQRLRPFLERRDSNDTYS